MPLLATGQPATDTPPGVIQVAIKNSVKVFYFQDSMDVLLFLAPDARLDKNVLLEQSNPHINPNPNPNPSPNPSPSLNSPPNPEQVFLEQWKSLTTEHRADVQGLANENVEAICPKMEAANVFFIARRKLPDGADLVYFSCKSLNNVTMLAELGFRPGTGACSISPNPNPKPKPKPNPNPNPNPNPDPNPNPNSNPITLTLTL